MAHDARAISNAILDYAKTCKIEVTPLKLQKLLYFCHGHSWRVRRIGLIFNRFQAWDHGPVVKVVYDEFKALGDANINSRAMWFNFCGGGRELANASLDSVEFACVRQTVDIYGPVDAFTLSNLSHIAGGPWDIVQRAVHRFPKKVIPESLLADYFSNRFSSFDHH